jgi:hypothetical protein
MRKLLAVVVLALAVAAACVSTNATRLGTAGAHPPTPPEAVALYRTADQVPGRYEEVALLHAEGASGWTSENKMYRALLKRAASVGANAVILDAISEPSAGAKVAAALFGVGAMRKGKALAIYILPHDQQPTPAPSASPAR